MATKAMLCACIVTSSPTIAIEGNAIAHIRFAQPIMCIQGHVYLILSLALKISSAAILVQPS